MSEDREAALQTALKYVLAAARDQGVDVDVLTEVVAHNLLRSTVGSHEAAEAIYEIEKAVDALVVE